MTANPRRRPTGDMDPSAPRLDGCGGPAPRTLDRLRAELDSRDEAILASVKERMQTVAPIHRAKARVGCGLFDRDRERAVFALALDGPADRLRPRLNTSGVPPCGAHASGLARIVRAIPIKILVAGAYYLCVEGWPL